MKSVAVMLLAALALSACGTSEEPTAKAPQPSASAHPAASAVSIDDVADLVAKAIDGTVEPGPEVWAVSLEDSDTTVCGGTVIDMSEGNPYPDEVVITDPAGRFGVYVPSPDDPQCLTDIGEALATLN